MKRSRAFVLSEILITMMLQAGFILVLCTSFYLLTSFYTKSQEVLTARNHAERVIQFMDDKIRHAGLGLWRCDDSAEMRARLSQITKLKTSQLLLTDPSKGYKLPVSLSWIKDGLDDMPKTSYTAEKFNGDVLVLLYTQREDSSTGSGGNYDPDSEVIMTFSRESDFDPATGKAVIKNVDEDQKSLFLAQCEITKEKTISSKNINRWAVADSIGMPFYIPKITDYPNIDICFYGNSSYPLPSDFNVPNAGELMYLKCMQIFVHTHPDDKDRQLAFRELNGNGDTWTPENGYNQEKGILEIYMELDTTNHIFTLWVLAQGGYDASASNPRPEIWPDKANWDEKEYPHYVTYVARKSWKLNNIPAGFNWN